MAAKKTKKRPACSFAPLSCSGYVGLGSLWIGRRTVPEVLAIVTGIDDALGRVAVSIDGQAFTQSFSSFISFWKPV